MGYTSSISLGQKIKEIRKAEGFTQAKFGEAVSLSTDGVKSIELGRSKNISSETLLNITNHPDFSKYALWLMTDQVNPEGGQISPEIKLQADQLRTG